jgi:hypothetical protein
MTIHLYFLYFLLPFLGNRGGAATA